MTLGQNIQNARRAQGLFREAKNKKIGVSRQALREALKRRGLWHK